MKQNLVYQYLFSSKLSFSVGLRITFDLKLVVSKSLAGILAARTAIEAVI